MSEFNVIETQEQFDKAIGERIKREQETIRKQYEGYLSPDEAAKKYEGYLSPDEVKKQYEGFLSPDEVAKKDSLTRWQRDCREKMRRVSRKTPKQWRNCSQEDDSRHRHWQIRRQERQVKTQQ